MLVVGGRTPTGVSPTAELFDPHADGGKGAWRTTGLLHHARARHTATLLANGKVIVIGGHGGEADDQSFVSAELYDPAADGGRGAWMVAGPRKEGRFEHRALRLSTGKVLIAGGQDATAHSARTIERYDPAGDSGRGASVVIGDLYLGDRPSATLLPNGEVLIVGIEPNEGRCVHNAQRLILSSDQLTIKSVGASDELSLCTLRPPSSPMAWCWL